MSKDKDDVLREKLLKICDQIHKLDHMVTDTRNPSASDDSMVRSDLESSVYELLEIAEKVESLFLV